MHSILLAASIFSAWLSPQTGFRGPSTIETVWANYSVGTPVDFLARVHTSETIVESRLVLEFGASRSVYHAQQGNVHDGYYLKVDQEQESDRPFPFMDVNYWWEVDFLSGETILSPAQTFQYIDYRFSWNRLAESRIILYWVEGDMEAAHDIVDLALFALGTVSAELETPIPDRVTLALYPRLADFHSALGNRIRGWEGAVSDPASGIILTAAASGAEGRQTLAVLLPHEITHILLAAKWESAAESLPLWLVEGTAAGYEIEGRPEADQVLREAVEEGGLIPLQTLCRVFPAEERPALLAYAESKSFVGFLKQTYGMDAVRRAMAEYAAGADCDRGLENSTGKTLNELESAWLDRLAGMKPWMASSWVLVSSGIVLLSGVLAMRWLVHRTKARVPAEREKTG